MAFVPSDALREELLRTPQLGRIVLALGDRGLEPTLVIKTNSLTLKYVIEHCRVAIVAFRINQHVGYAADLDDWNGRTFAWSLVETEDERTALKRALAGETCTIHLLNEASVTVASAAAPLICTSRADIDIDSATLHTQGHENLHEEVGRLVDAIAAGSTVPAVASAEARDLTWRPITSVLITSRAETSPVSIFDCDEGAQQERLGLWLTDHLHPGAVVSNPHVGTASARRELCDLAITYDGGSMLIESKALTIFARPRLPARADLVNDNLKHVTQASRQLAGAARALRGAAPLTDRHGRPVHLERQQPPHGIVLVPDLGLFSDVDRGTPLQLVRSFREKTRGFLHFLDPNGLLRASQAAAMLSRAGTRTTPMMAFDAHLLERWSTALALGRVDFDSVLRIDGDDPSTRGPLRA